MNKVMLQKRLSLAAFQGRAKGFTEIASEKPTVLHTGFCSLTNAAARSTSPHKTTVFHARPFDRFIEIKSSLRRKKLHITNFIEQSSNFL